ncbi:MAG TPA: hypothetical protein PLB62_02695 [Candidatus Sumerlaeota bacterium]|nr:hypothetical protein [Candidatus Sumerlaeota bacterium]
MIRGYIFLFIPLLLPLFSCSLSRSATKTNPVIDYKAFPRRISIPASDPELKKIFFGDAKAEWREIARPDGTKVAGYANDNRLFLEKVMAPIIEENRTELAAMHPVELINTLTLFSHEIFRVYFGPDTFSWGGDILDLDDPQIRGPRYEYRFGLDCSGFSSMPYELAVYFGFLKPDDPAAVFSSPGFEIYTKAHGLPDRGGRDGASNRYRVDTSDMKNLGRVIFTVSKDGAAAPEDLEKLQAGDLVLLPAGHVGIVVEILGDFYFLEAGGWVVPPNGGLPYAIAPAIEIFAKQGPLEIRRSLPDHGRLAP